MRAFVPLFIIVPLIELGLFMLSGKYLGIIPTLVIVVLTGFFGARLAKREGLKVFKKAREQLQMGQLPGAELLEGLCVFAGGLLLLTPGYLTDLTGLILLLPWSRKRIVLRIRRELQKRLASGAFHFYYRK